MTAAFMSDTPRTIAIIPARGGSKRIPRKNIKPFFGKPVIAYAIETLRKSNLFSHIIVSTDDDEVADIATCFGAIVPWRRPAELCTDEASTDAVVAHAVTESLALYGQFAYGCCVYPVNPLLDASTLHQALAELKSHQAASVFSVVRYEFPIEQALRIEDRRPRFLWREEVDKGSQSLPAHYHDAGIFYWFDVAKFQRHPALFSEDSIAFEVSPMGCQDVNTTDDWALAELKYLRLTKSGDSWPSPA